MLDSVQMTALIMKHSLFWVRNSINYMDVKSSLDENIFNMMIVETNIYIVHIFDREVFQYCGATTRNQVLDDLLDIFPYALAESLNPNNKIRLDEVNIIKKLFNDRQAEYSYFPLIDEEISGTVAGWFIEHYYSLTAKCYDSILSKISLQLWAAGCLQNFVEKLFIMKLF